MLTFVKNSDLMRRGNQALMGFIETMFDCGPGSCRDDWNQDTDGFVTLCRTTSFGRDSDSGAT
jgi:hypothetical protein